MPKQQNESAQRRTALRRWLLLTALAMGALTAMSLLLGPYLWNQAQGRTLVFFVYLFWMAAMLGAAFVAATLVIHLLFPAAIAQRDNPHRKAPPKPDDDEFMEPDNNIALFQPLSLYYSLFVVLFLLASIGLSNLLSKSALSQFVHIQYEAMSRSKDSQELLNLFQELTEMEQSDEVSHFTRKLPDFYDNADELVRAKAFHTTAVMARRTNISIAILNQNGELANERWEPELLKWFKDDVAPILKTLYKREIEPKSEIVLALAWIIREEDTSFFSTLLSDRKTPPDVASRAATGLGNIATMDAANILVAALPTLQSEVRLQALWALHVIGDTMKPDMEDEAQGETLLTLCQDILDASRTFEPANRCAALMATRTFQHAGLTKTLIDLFESDWSDIQCPRIEIQPLYGPPRLFVSKDAMRWHILEFLADIGRNNPTLSNWLLTLPPDPTRNPRVTEALTNLKENLQ